MRFADPFVLLLLVLPIVLLLLRRRRGPTAGAIAFSVSALASKVPRTRRATWAARLPLFEALGVALCIVALARPQRLNGSEKVTLKSRNIMVAIDISSSMKATDFQPGDRLTVAKQTLSRFIQKRDGDLVGLVLFAGRTFLQAPLTPDVQLVSRMLETVEIGQLPDGTAIGTALGMALTQIKLLPPTASAVVLITDGAQNTGSPSLPEATEIARAIGVRVHAIGLSSLDTASVDLNGVWSVGDRASRLTSADEKVLARVAARTGGQYARATDPAALDSIMNALDPLERQDVLVKESKQYTEFFPIALVLGVLLLAGARVLGATRLRVGP